MKTFLVISLLLNAYLVIRGIDVISGGGMHEQSPDMAHTVMINSQRNLNPFATDREVYAEISLHNGFIADERLKTVIVRPISESYDSAYRSLKDPIQWSNDSQEVTVTTPDFTLSINLHPKPPNKTDAGNGS